MLPKKKYKNTKSDLNLETRVAETLSMFGEFDERILKAIFFTDCLNSSVAISIRK